MSEVEQVVGMEVQDYGENDDAGGFFDDFVERYEQQRALTIEDVLEDIETKLYNPDIISIGTEGDKGAVDSNLKALEEDYPRHFDGVGYAAHHDGVDDAEVLSISLLHFLFPVSYTSISHS